MWIKKRFCFFVFVIVFWLTACIPVTGQESPWPTALPTETATPPAEENEFVTYQDLKNKYEITYSKEMFTPTIKDSNAGLFVLVLDVGKLFAGKNLENVTVTISASRTCRFRNIYTEKNFTGEETINNITFSIYSNQDTRTSANVFQILTYETFHNDLCYEIHLEIRAYSLTAFPDVSEYDPEIIIIEIKNLLSTFKLIE